MHIMRASVFSKLISVMKYDRWSYKKEALKVTIMLYIAVGEITLDPMLIMIKR